MPYTPPNKDAVDFELSSTQPITDLSAVDFDLAGADPASLAAITGTTIDTKVGLTLDRQDRTKITASTLTPTETTPLGSPNNLQTSVDKTDVTVSWDDGSNLNTHSFIYRDGVLVGATRESSTQYTDYDLQESTTYTYTATNAILDVSSPSNAAASTSPTVTRDWGTDWGTMHWSGDDPNTLSVSVPNDRNQLSWTSEQRDEDGYLVYRSTQPEQPYSDYELIAATTSQSYTDDEVSASADTYYYRVTDFTIVEESEVAGPVDATTEAVTVNIDNVVTPASAFVFTTSSDGLATDQGITAASAETLQILVSSQVDEQGVVPMSATTSGTAPSTSAQEPATVQSANVSSKDAVGSIDVAKALTAINLKTARTGTLTASGTITTAGDPGILTDAFGTGISATDQTSAIDEDITTAIASPQVSAELTSVLEPSTLSSIGATIRQADGTALTTDDATVTSAVAVVDGAQATAGATSSGISSASVASIQATETATASNFGVSPMVAAPIAGEAAITRVDGAALTTAAVDTRDTAALSSAGEPGSITPASSDTFTTASTASALGGETTPIVGATTTIDADSLADDFAGLSPITTDTFSSETVENDDPGTLAQVDATSLTAADTGVAVTDGVSDAIVTPITSTDATSTFEEGVLQTITTVSKDAVGSIDVAKALTAVNLKTAKAGTLATDGTASAGEPGRITDSTATTLTTGSVADADDSGLSPFVALTTTPTTSSIENLADGPLSTLTANPLTSVDSSSAFEDGTRTAAAVSPIGAVDSGGALDEAGVTSVDSTTATANESIVEGVSLTEVSASTIAAIDTSTATADQSISQASVSPFAIDADSLAGDGATVSQIVTVTETATDAGLTFDHPQVASVTSDSLIINAVAGANDEGALQPITATPVVSEQGITTESDLALMDSKTGTESLVTGGAGVSIAYDAATRTDITSDTSETDELSIGQAKRAVSGPATFSIETIDADAFAFEEGTLTKAFMSRLIDSEGVKNAGSDLTPFAFNTFEAGVGIAPITDTVSAEFETLEPEVLVAVAAELASASVQVQQIEPDVFLVGVGYSYPVFPDKSVSEVNALTGGITRTEQLDDPITETVQLSGEINSVKDMSDTNDVEELEQ